MKFLKFILGLIKKPAVPAKPADLLTRRQAAKIEDFVCEAILAGNLTPDKISESEKYLRALFVDINGKTDWESLPSHPDWFLK